MRVRFQKTFNKQFGQLSDFQKQLVKDTIETFGESPFHASLRNHPLGEEWKGYHSISADDDLRLHFKILDDDTALFVAVGTHKQLYR